MGALEERVAYLEGRGEEHAAAIGEARADIRDLRTDLRDFRVAVNQRFDRIDARFDRFETRFDTRFMWLVGFQFATFMAIIAAVLNGYFR
jgi:predicted secreted Zn-dependent protease